MKRRLWWNNCISGVLVAALVASIPAFGQILSSPKDRTAVPSVIRFTGVLRQPSGATRTGVVGILFAVYRDQEGGVPIWQETQNVQLDAQGRFTVLLGSVTSKGLPPDLFIGADARWIGVQPLIPGEREQPRVQLVSVPYAMKAADADTVGGLPPSAFVKTSDSSATGSVNVIATEPGQSTRASKTAPVAGEQAVTTPGATVNAIPKSSSSTSIIDSQITDSNGMVGMQNFENVRYAEHFPGADCGAKINAADSDLGAQAGEIWVNQLCGSTWPTTVNLSSGHTLRFIQGGVFTAGSANLHMIAVIGSPGSHKANIHVVGAGVGQTYLRAANPGKQLGAVLQFAYCDDCSAESLTADGNGNTTVVLVDEMNVRFVARNLRLLGDTTHNPIRNYCAHVRGSQFGTYENIDLRGGSQDAFDIGIGPFGNPTQGAQWNHFSNIVAHDSPWNGIDLGGSASIAVQNNSFTNVTVVGNGTYSAGNDDRNGLNLNYASYNQFQGVNAWNNQFSGIRINGGVGNVFTGLDSQQNGRAGANTGDGIRLEFGTAQNPNYGNIFIGNVRSWGSNYAVQTKGSNTSYNVFNLEIGSSPILMATTNDILRLVRTVGGMESISGLDLSLVSFAKCPGAPGIANVVNVGICLSGPVKVAGNLSVSGSITGATKHFKIDHPLDPANRYLYHASVESSEMLDIYSGNVTLDSHGEATVELPAWFEALNRDFRYQLSSLGGFAPVYVAQEITNNTFRIGGGTPGMKVSWQITGVRHDDYSEKHPMRVEEEKSREDQTSGQQ